MNSRPTAILVVLFCLLAGAVWFFELRTPATAKTDPGQSPVFDLKAEDVTRVEVTDQGKTAAVERTDDKWRLVQPSTDEGDSRRIDDTIGRIAKLTANRKLDDASDLAGYGLVDPSTRLEIKMKDGSSQELLIGSKTPDQSAYYVKRGDSPAVFVAPSFSLSDAIRWPSDPPKPRPTATPLPLSPAPPLPVPATKPAG
jgi:hypothetical protein